MEQISLFEVEVCCLGVFVDHPMFIPIIRRGFWSFLFPHVYNFVISGDLVEVYPMLISIFG